MLFSATPRAILPRRNLKFAHWVFLPVFYFVSFISFPAAANPFLEDPAYKPLISQLGLAKDEFLAGDDFAANFKRLNELEAQALQLSADEPLKLGSLGSAILDIYPASQTGHFVLQKFYAHVGANEAYNRHTALLDYLQQAMQRGGDGSFSAPYPVMTIHDAHAFAQTNRGSPVGSIFQSNNSVALGYLMVVQPGKGDKGALDHIAFNLEHLLEGFTQSGSPATDEAAPPDLETQLSYVNNPWVLIRLFAADGDTAAQSAIGAYLASLQKYDQAIGWLKVAARTGNLLANRLLARIYMTKAEDSEDEQTQAQFKDLALENHMHAIALGSTNSMYTLANLYLNNYFGEDNKEAGLPLLEQAADLGHTESLIYLGHLYNNGRQVDKDLVKADEYFALAANSDDPQAIINYGRFLTADPTRAANSSIFSALQNIAGDGQPEAMVVLGNLYARGIGTPQSIRSAVRWYKRAVRKAPDNADIVNEVAWTLTVSDVEGLKRGRYAKRIMDKLMSDAAMRERPEYLDTWAAAHAAIGNFEEAVKLQEQAIAVATAQQRTDVMDILKEHLEQFKSSTTITEKAP